MQTIEMECFEATKFLELAAEAEKIRVTPDQFNFLKNVWSISAKMWVDMDRWMIFDADILIEEVEEGAPRNIVFEMFDYAALGLELPFIPHKQTILHNPPVENGNCMQTVIAGLLGKQIHEVPHFGAGLTFDRSNAELKASEGVVFMERVQSYLKSINYRYFEVLYDATWEGVKASMTMNGGIPMLISGMSERGQNHSIIFYNGEVYDPHPDNTGLVAPMDNGYFAVGVLVKIPGYFAKEI